MASAASSPLPAPCSYYVSCPTFTSIEYLHCNGVASLLLSCIQMSSGRSSRGHTTRGGGRSRTSRIDDPPIVVPSPPTVVPSPPTVVPSPPTIAKT
ncbi:uncharacterized protein G2W53_022223 [Senna tora]|uniref:Uncharacterized protein n=1 Tax=Senna tora TaxID=362788 RepID=A0A834TMM2_9FABA|nr:uncharacterized protein G2W53_022223 [Senna tora]